MSIAVNYMNQNAKNSRPVQMMGPPPIPLNSLPPNSMPNSMPNSAPPQQQPTPPHYTQAQIQKILDDNNHLIQSLADSQSKGKMQDSYHLSTQLHRNLELMFRVTDNTANIQSFLLPPTNFSQSAPANPMSNGIHHPPPHLNAQQQPPQQNSQPPQQPQTSMPPPLPMHQAGAPQQQSQTSSTNNLPNPHLQTPHPSQINPNQMHPNPSQAPQQNQFSSPMFNAQQAAAPQAHPPPPNSAQQIPVSQSPSANSISQAVSQSNQPPVQNQPSQNPSPSTTPNQANAEQQSNSLPPPQTSSAHMNPAHSQPNTSQSQGQFRAPNNQYPMMPPPPPRQNQPYNPNMPPSNQAAVPPHYPPPQQGYSGQPYSQPPHPQYSPQYPPGSYNNSHYRPPTNVPAYNYDATNSNWNDPSYGKMPNYNNQSGAMPPGVPNQPGVGYKPSSMSNQYPGYNNHYRQPSNPAYNYDANNANWNDPAYGKMPNYNNQSAGMPPVPGQTPPNSGPPPQNPYYYPYY